MIKMLLSLFTGAGLLIALIIQFHCMLIVITEAVQDLQTVQHAPIVRVVPIVLQVVLVVYAVVVPLRENVFFRRLFKKKSSGGSRNLKSGYSKVI